MPMCLDAAGGSLAEPGFGRSDVLKMVFYDAKLREKFPPDVAVWMEGGRRRTGDPANL
jgi:hypothetical protein